MHLQPSPAERQAEPTPSVTAALQAPGKDRQGARDHLPVGKANAIDALRPTTSAAVAPKWDDAPSRCAARTKAAGGSAGMGLAVAGDIGAEQGASSNPRHDPADAGNIEQLDGQAAGRRPRRGADAPLRFRPRPGDDGR